MIMQPLVGLFQGLLSEPFVSGFHLGVRCTSLEKECVLTNECTLLTETTALFLFYCYECSSFGWLSYVSMLIYRPCVDRGVESQLTERNWVFRNYLCIQGSNRSIIIQFIRQKTSKLFSTAVTIFQPNSCFFFHEEQVSQRSSRRRMLIIRKYLRTCWNKRVKDC